MATTYQDKIRSKLQNKIFSRIAKTVTLKSKSAPSYNDRGEEESQTYNSSSISIVPYNIINNNQTYQEFGALEEGSMDAAIPYTVTVNIDDIITIDTVDYYVKQIAKNYLPDNVVTIVRLTKRV